MTIDLQRLVDHEIERADAAHKPINSPHEGYAVIKEELDEFWDEVKERNRDYDSMLRELVQVSATAIRTARCVLSRMDREQLRVLEKACAGEAF